MNEILFGHDPEQCILAVTQHSESSMMIYRREDGRVTATEREFFPFFHLSDNELLDGFSRKHWLKKLEGSNYYQYVCAFDGTQDMWDAVRFIIEKINLAQGRHVNSFKGIDDLYLRPFPVTQYLMQSGKTLFKGMTFDDIYRLQIDIRTYAKDHRLSRAERKEDRVLTIALCDNRGWERVLGSKSLSEPELFRRFVEVLREKDPDVIEGDHLFNHVLPYLMKRSELLEVELTIGRDGSVPRGSASRTSFGEFDVEYMTYEVIGRHLIDLWLLKQSREGSGLQSVKPAVAPGDHGISALWEKASAEVKERALEAVHDVRASAAELSSELFHLTQMLPYNYGTVARLGAAAKVDALMLREYLRLRHSIPKPESGVPPTGVSAELYYTGVFDNIIQIELESLYPRLLLAQEVRPSTDPLHAFHSILQQLMVCNMDAVQAKESNAYQLLIDSLYPYLNHRRNIFSDQERGSELARDARELLARAVREVELHNGIVIQTEETTLFCQPPDNVSGEKAELAFVGHVGAQLPEEVHLVLRNRYRRMASYRKRSYGLLDYHERMMVHGTALNPRTIERFGRSYLQMSLDCILRLDFENLHKLYVELQQSIRERQLDVADIVRTETLHDALEVYRQDAAEEKRNHAPAYEAALRSSRSFSPGDKISYYISSRGTHQREAEAAREASEWDLNFPDEDTSYYLRRLEDFSKRFEVFFAEKDFKRIFSSDDLFGFEGEPIIPVTQKETADSTSAAADSKIMLDL
jgi:DNA polymerase elongation subunit (family B)